MRNRKDIWFLVALFVILFVGGYFSTAPKSTKEDLKNTTYNPDPKGVKAFYTLLGEGLGYRVGRLQRPFTEIPQSARVLIVVEPGTRDPDVPEMLQKDTYIDAEQRTALLAWVRRGGTVMFYSDDLKGVPGTFGSDQKIGRGAVYAVNSSAPIINRGMRNPSNAIAILSKIDRHAGKRDLILFDEYHHGFETGDSVWSHVGSQVWIAVGMLLAAGVVLCYSCGRRFGAVRELPREVTLRPGFEFVKSVGRLYDRAGSADLAAEILCRSFKRRLCAKQGIPVDAPAHTITSRLGPDAAKRVSAMLSACSAYAAGQKPSERELVEIATQIHELEEELCLGRISA